jgi:hypothetical protein
MDQNNQKKKLLPQPLSHHQPNLRNLRLHLTQKHQLRMLRPQLKAKLLQNEIDLTAITFKCELNQPKKD